MFASMLQDTLRMVLVSILFRFGQLNIDVLSCTQDGWGSYPEQLQKCPIFQHAYQLGRRFYLAFQQHTNLAQAHQQANLFGFGQSYSFIRQMGSNIALVAPDVRAERTRNQVVSPESWQLIFARLAALPSSVRHIVFLTTIPVVYPKVAPLVREIKH